MKIIQHHFQETMTRKHSQEFVKKYIRVRKWSMDEKEKYINNHAILKTLRCPEGHSAPKTFSKFKMGHRCKICSGKEKYTIEFVKTYIKDQGWSIDDNEKYVNNKGVLKTLRCPSEHPSPKSFSSFFVIGRRCNTCVGHDKYTDKFVKTYIRDRTWSIDEEEKYVNNKTTLKTLRCPYGHPSPKPFQSFKNNKARCATCIIYKSEEAARECFEDLMECKFIKTRDLDWLINNDTGQPLELDGYSHEDKCAFEYQGLQHYEYIPYFHDTIKDFENQQKRDRLKYRLCYENNVKLFIIPPEFTYKNKRSMKTYIEDLLINEGYFIMI